jgi:hypothetical protein
MPVCIEVIGSRGFTVTDPLWFVLLSRQAIINHVFAKSSPGSAGFASIRWRRAWPNQALTTLNYGFRALYADARSGRCRSRWHCSR